MVEVQHPKAAHNEVLPKFLIIFSSPNPKRYKEILKIPGCRLLVMRMWTYEEIFLAHGAIKNLKKIPISTIEEKFRIYGPVPRHVFEENPVTMATALATKGMSAATNMLINNELESRENDMSYMLMHMHPADEATFQGKRMRPAYINDSSRS